MRKRLFFIMQYEKNPITEEDLYFNEAVIKKALEHRIIKKYAYIKHDKDVYSEADEKADRSRLKNEYNDLTKEQKEQISEMSYIEQNLIKRQGQTKPVHWHILLKCDNNIELDDIARYFNIPSNYVDLPKGRGNNAFYDCLEYLTHESPAQQALGKHLYADDEVKANFNWREELNNYLSRKALNKGKYTDDVSFCEHEVAYNGMTLKTVREKYEDVWLKRNEINILRKLRGSYLEAQPAPTNRINFYICGEGGTGKGLLSVAIARTLYPDLDDDDCFFNVGAKNVTFEDYDGQPVIIWDDFRAVDFIGTSNNRGHAFRLLEPNPKKSKENVKNSKTQLLNQVNIINSVQPFEEFLEGLAGSYVDRFGCEHEAEDKKQSYRRFPIIIPIHENDFTFLINNAYLLNNSDWDQYTAFMQFHINLKKMAEKMNYDKELHAKADRQLLEPVREKMQNLIKKPVIHNKSEQDAIIADIMDNVVITDCIAEAKMKEEEHELEIRPIKEECKELLNYYVKYYKELLQKYAKAEAEGKFDEDCFEIWDLKRLISNVKDLTKSRRYEEALYKLKDYKYEPPGFDLAFE